MNNIKIDNIDIGKGVRTYYLSIIFEDLSSANNIIINIINK